MASFPDPSLFVSQAAGPVEAKLTVVDLNQQVAAELDKAVARRPKATKAAAKKKVRARGVRV